MESPEINRGTLDILSLTKEARIHNEEKTVSTITGAEKTAQLCVKE